MTYMNPPDELMVKVFLPSIRALVAHRLKARGLSQGKIAKLLDVTQASVHYYLSGGEKEHYERVGLLGFREEEVEGLVGALCEDLMKSEVEGLRTLYSFWIDALAKGRVCEAHRKMHPGLKDCDVCMAIFSRGREGDELLFKDMKEAIRLIESAPYFSRVMPEVSVNLVLARDEAKSVEDVLAVPGRIVKVMGRPKALMEPRFGASTHMARVLLLAHERDKGVRASINLKFDDKVKRCLKELGLSYRFIPTKGEELPSIKGVIRGGVPDALIYKGKVGIEPVTYLFGKSATEVARMALKVARLYSIS